MRRGLTLFVNLGLLTSVVGCSRGVCDCLVYPINHGTPSPIVKPASAVGEPSKETRKTDTAEPTPKPNTDAPPSAE